MAVASGKKEPVVVDQETNEKYEEIKRGEMHITELQKMTIKELQDTAKREGIKEYTGLKKQDLIFKILKERVNQNGLMYGEGVVEVLPEGFGFLRSPIIITYPARRYLHLPFSNPPIWDKNWSGSIRSDPTSQRYREVLRITAGRGYQF